LSLIILRGRVASSVVFYTLILRTIKLLTWLVTINIKGIGKSIATTFCKSIGIGDTFSV